MRGEVPVRLADGRALTLVLDFEGLVAAEALYGKPVAMLIVDAAQEFLGAVRALLYGALRAKHPELTPADAGAIIQSDGDRISAALESATQRAFPEPGEAEGKEGGNPRKAGTRSGRSGAKRGSTPKASGAPRRARSS